MLPCKTQLSTNTQSLGEVREIRRFFAAGRVQKPEVNITQLPKLYLTKIYQYIHNIFLPSAKGCAKSPQKIVNLETSLKGLHNC